MAHPSGTYLLALIIGSSFLPAVSAQDENSSVDGIPPKPKPSIDEAFIFQPAGPGIGQWDPDDLAFREVTFDSTDGVTLHGWYCPARAPVAVVLYLHGNAGNITHRATVLRHLQQQMNVSILIFDYRGYGRSTGIPQVYATVKGAVEDSRVAQKKLSELASVPEADVVLLGRSLGGAIAVELAATQPCRGLILESTFSSLKAIAEHHTPRLAWLVPPDKLNSVSRIRRFQGPLLLSHGDRDRVVPYTFGVDLFKAAGNPKRFVRIPNGGHNDRPPEVYYRAMSEFLRDLPPGRG